METVILDKAKLKEKFENVYRDRIEPKLVTFEKERIRTMNKAIILLIMSIISLTLTFSLGEETNALIVFLLFSVAAGIPIYLAYKEIPKFQKKTKNSFLRPILSIFGEFYHTKKTLISIDEIKSYMLFPYATHMKADDILFGTYKSLDIYIQDVLLSHPSSSSNTSTDFKGLIIKIPMNKNFNGVTIVRNRFETQYMQENLKRVDLEDPMFGQMYNVFSDDQIEARYILTTAFMEKLKKVGEIFSPKTGDESFSGKVSCVFRNGYVILTISTLTNFLEIGDICQTMHDKSIYKKVFYQMISIFDLVDTLKLEQKLGM